MMPTDGFQPPYIVHVLKSNAVVFVGSIGFQQFAQTQNPFARTMNIGQNERNEILFTDAAWHFRNVVGIAFFALFWNAFNKRIRTLYTWIGRQGFCRRHGDIAGVYTDCCPLSFSQKRIRHCRIAQRIFRKRNFNMRKNGTIDFGLLFRKNNVEAFFGKTDASAVFITGNQR